MKKLIITVLMICFAQGAFGADDMDISDDDMDTSTDVDADGDEADGDEGAGGGAERARQPRRLGHYNFDNLVRAHLLRARAREQQQQQQQQLLLLNLQHVQLLQAAKKQ